MVDWSDILIGYCYGIKFVELFNNEDIIKNIFNLMYVSGFKYGFNFFNVDMLMFDKKDLLGVDVKSGVYEVYIVYCNMLDFEKMSGILFKFIGICGYGFIWGFDYNMKIDVGYNFKKCMLVLGFMVNFDVLGFMNVSLLLLCESNVLCSDFIGICVLCYIYKMYLMLMVVWGILLGVGFFFEGFFNYIVSKGKDEFGGLIKFEMNFDV